MKKLFMILSFTGAALFTFAQEKAATPAPGQGNVPATPAAAPDPNAPDFKWESTTIDYGSNVTKGDESAAGKEFHFTNVGKSPLIIASCHGSCGCTVPTCPTEPILPGAKGSIKVHYDINRVGPFTKTVTVSSNAKTPNETLKINGTVVDPNAGKTPPPSAPVTTPTPAPMTSPSTPK